MEESRKEEGRVGVYTGKSSRSLYERSKEHLSDAEGFQEGSHIVKHWMQQHAEDDVMPHFTFTILQSFRDCLSRQVAEAIRIHYSKDTLLNSKNEYGSNRLARVMVEEDAYSKKKRGRKEEMEEVMEKRRWEQFKEEHRRKPKRKPEEVETLPAGWMRQPKRLKRMETKKAAQEKEFDIQGLWKSSGEDWNQSPKDDGVQEQGSGE